MKGLGERIKTLRKERKITLVEVAHKTGIDQATLSRIENGKMTGTIESHMKIAEALGIRLPQLYEDLVNKVEEAQDKIAKKKLESFSHSSGAVAELLTSAVLQKCSRGHSRHSRGHTQGVKGSVKGSSLSLQSRGQGVKSFPDYMSDGSLHSVV